MLREGISKLSRLVLPAVAGLTIWGCVALQGKYYPIHRFKKDCSAEAKEDVDKAISGIIKSVNEFDWKKVLKECATPGRVETNFNPCKGKTPEQLRIDFGRILRRLMMIRTAGDMYCPFGLTEGIVGSTLDRRIYLIEPNMSPCRLQEVLFHEAHHVEGNVGLDFDVGDKDPEIHSAGVDYVYRLGQIIRNACKNAHIENDH
jgi:hypothetical protein